jgi:aerobic-type carbon monoxide dehydrogenase small subunit (CoxS/CutS family)
VIIDTTINREQAQLDVRPNQTLIEVIRDTLGLRGTEEGCGVGVCGSCTVLVDDRPVSSCLVLAVDVEGRSITTIEGLSDGEILDPIQDAFLEFQAFQCGYCTPGMIMAVKGLLSENPAPDRTEAIDYLSGNICRCGTYEEVLKAVASLRSDRERRA